MTAEAGSQSPSPGTQLEPHALRAIEIPPTAAPSATLPADKAPEHYVAGNILEHKDTHGLQNSLVS